MRQTIAWHKECLGNRASHVLRCNELAAQAQLDCRVARLHFDYLCRQIEEAERRGLLAFDADRFMKKRRMK